MSHTTILESNEAYEMIEAFLTEMPSTLKSITMRKDDEYFIVSYSGGGYWLYNNKHERGTSPLSDKSEVIEELTFDLHTLYHKDYTLEIDRKKYKLRNN